MLSALCSLAGALFLWKTTGRGDIVRILSCFDVSYGKDKTACAE